MAHTVYLVIFLVWSYVGNLDSSEGELCYILVDEKIRELLLYVNELCLYIPEDIIFKYSVNLIIKQYWLT